MLLKKKHRHILLIQKLDRIIKISLPKSSRLSSTTEIAFKLIPAVAVASLTTYLILFDRTWELPTNVIASAIYCLGMLALGMYICINRNNKLMRHLHAIATIISFVWLLLHLEKVSQPIDLKTNLLYATSFLVSTSAIIFFLISNMYAAPRRSNQFSFADCRFEAIAELVKFSTKEINIAIFDLEKMRDRLQRRIDVYLLLAPLLTILLWIFSTVVFSLSSHSWWLDAGYEIYGSILSLLLSTTVIFIVIDDIRSRQKSDRYFLYVLILLEYDIERLNTNLLLKKTFD